MIGYIIIPSTGTNGRERMTVTNDNTVTNSQALKISLSEQLKNIKRQKQEEFHQFKSKQPIYNNMNEPLLKLKHQGLYPSGTTAIVRDSIINSVIEERINKKDRPVKVHSFPRATVADMQHYLIPIIQIKTPVKESLPKYRLFISTPRLRADDGKTQIMVSQLKKYILQLKIDTI